MIVDGRDFRSRDFQVTYRGYLRLNDYFGVPPLQVETIDRNIPVEIRTMSNEIREGFDKNNPEFDIVVSPEGNQIDIEIFMRNIFTLIEMQVPPPRGLSSLKYLTFDEARITFMNGETQRVQISGHPPSFDFVSQDISIDNVGLQLDFRARDRYEITLDGTTDIDSITFDTTITKDAEDEDYRVFMIDSQNQIISYSQLENFLIPSISTAELHLQPDEVSSPYLNNLLITQEGLHLTDPNITMQFQPYMIYRVEGFHDTDQDSIVN